ncbi:hypothetical protein [Microbacterium saperdae]|uniref:Flagellar hook-length control protein FliK n=1 Tax=Microbacterium saperdae TaxID=69368 RepID=A0A543BM95_9MICO|nr:hypothetical protein [Microbacterium saperdae]TQL85947.1 flagellar hook-length control protein FliK [Microbacterium saperdae]GGM51799.1 hypothetical protein GCM10010489_24160 [Microbacterium saperdae]
MSGLSTASADRTAAADPLGALLGRSGRADEGESAPFGVAMAVAKRMLGTGDDTMGALDPVALGVSDASTTADAMISTVLAPAMLRVDVSAEDAVDPEAASAAAAETGPSFTDTGLSAAMAPLAAVSSTAGEERASASQDPALPQGGSAARATVSPLPHAEGGMPALAVASPSAQGSVPAPPLTAGGADQVPVLPAARMSAIVATPGSAVVAEAEIPSALRPTDPSSATSVSPAQPTPAQTSLTPPTPAQPSPTPSTGAQPVRTAPADGTPSIISPAALVVTVDTAAVDAPEPGALPPRAVAAQVSPVVLSIVQRPIGSHQLTMTVTPDTLGPVTVRAHVSAGGDVRVELLGATEAGREALRTIVTDLRRDLAAAMPHASLTLGSGTTAEGGGADRGAQSGAGGPMGGQSSGGRESDRTPSDRRAADAAARGIPHSSLTATHAVSGEGLDIFA